MEDIKKNTANDSSVSEGQESKKRKHSEGDTANTNNQNENVWENGNVNKYQKSGKKDRKRGQNKVCVHLTLYYLSITIAIEHFKDALIGLNS